jgi:hypothetical protein
MDCLDGMIGITREECACFAADIAAMPAALKESAHGLFLDELNQGIGLGSINSVKDCGNGLADMFTKSIEQAQDFYKADLLAALAVLRKRAYDPFTGFLGSRNFARTYLPSKSWAGVRIEPRNIIGAYMSMSKIHFYFESTELALPVRILELRVDSAGDQFITELAAFTVNTVANTDVTHTLATALRLPLWDAEGRKLQYYIIYDRSSNINPKDNKTRCNCGTQEQRMLQYIDIRGVQVDADADLYGSTAYAEAMGVIPEVDMSCGSDDMICDAIAIDEAVRLTTAYALWYKAGELLIDKLLHSAEISRYTMANREQLYGDKKSYRSQYFDRITWISQHMDHSGTDCYKCDEEKGIFKTGIRST